MTSFVAGADAAPSTPASKPDKPARLVPPLGNEAASALWRLRTVADREDVRDRGAHVVIDHDAAVNRNSRLAGQAGFGNGPATHDEHVRQHLGVVR